MGFINKILKGSKERAAFLQNQAASKPIFNLTKIKNQTIEMSDKLYTEKDIIDALWNGMTLANNSFEFQQKHIDRYVKMLKRTEEMANIIIDGIERIKVSQPNERTYTQQEVNAIEKKAYFAGLFNTAKFTSIDDLYENYKAITLKS